MSIKFNVCLNNGNEAFGTGKTITANEVCEVADNGFVAHQVQLHTHGLITEDIAKIVLDNFCETVAELVGQGYAVQLCKGGDVMLTLGVCLRSSGGLMADVRYNMGNSQLASNFDTKVGSVVLSLTYLINFIK